MAGTRTFKPLAFLLLMATVATGALAAMEIIVTEESGHNTLDLAVSQTDLLVAVVTEISTEGGYTVTLETVNGTSTGLFTGANLNNSETLSYDIKYDNTLVSLSGGSAVVTDSGSATSEAGINKDLRISYVGITFLAADTYSDTLILTIAAQ